MASTARLRGSQRLKGKSKAPRPITYKTLDNLGERRYAVILRLLFGDGEIPLTEESALKAAHCVPWDCAVRRLVPFRQRMIYVRALEAAKASWTRGRYAVLAAQSERAKALRQQYDDTVAAALQGAEEATAQALAHYEAGELTRVQYNKLRLAAKNDAAQRKKDAWRAYQAAQIPLTDLRLKELEALHEQMTEAIALGALYAYLGKEPVDNTAGSATVLGEEESSL